MAYILTDEDLATLAEQNAAAITEARASADTPDDKLAHLFQLRGKLVKIAEKRGDEPMPDEPTAEEIAAKKAAAKTARAAAKAAKNGGGDLTI